MAKNRRTGADAASLRALVWVLVLFVGFGGSGLGYIWHRHRNDELSRQINRKHAHLEEVRMQNQVLERQLEDLRSHRALEERARELHLGLVMPQPEQILRLSERTGTSVASSLVAPVRGSLQTAQR